MVLLSQQALTRQRDVLEVAWETTKLEKCQVF